MKHVLLALALAASCAACSSGNSAGPSAPNAGRHEFEGFIDYRGIEGAPPGRPWSAACAVKGDVYRCELVIEGRSSGAVGMRGSMICYQPTPAAGWLRLDLATVGFVFSLLPASMRHDAIAQAQAQTSWTGRTEQVLGRTCYELETRTKEGVERYCYSDTEFFGGADQLLPVLRQMGYDNTFISSMAKGGIGWKGQEWDESGRPKMFVEASRIDPRPVDPNAVAGVCR